MASPAPRVTAPSAAAAPTPPVNGAGAAAPRVIRRRDNSNPLVSRKKPQRPPRPHPSPTPAAATAASTPSADAVKEEEDESQWQTFKLTTTKASLLKGLRHHVMRLQSKNTVNPVNEDEFSRPIRLHRRDPRAPLQGVKEQKPGEGSREGSTGTESNVKDEEQAKREAERTAQLEKIAPYGGAQKQKNHANRKKTDRVYKGVDEKEKKLRYEEYFPWFMEDFDNKNTWQGQLEQSLSNTFAMFVLNDGAFRMVPLEKWYKFTEKNKYKTLGIEEAEEQMKKSTRPPRWIMKVTNQEEKERRMRDEMKNAAAAKKMFTRKGDRLEHLVPKSETADADDLDFEEDRFADDEEAPIMDGPDEENKEIEQRIKKEQLSANYFDARDERDYEAEERERKRYEELRKKLGKRTKKALMNREGNFTYETDSDDNPYGSSSDEEDSEAEALKKEEERKKEEEAKKAQQSANEKPEKEKAAAAPAPPDKKPKVSPQKTKPKAQSLKRSGSADLSSGTESARKKSKVVQATQPTPSASPGQENKLVKLKVPADKVSQVMSSTPSAALPAANRKRKAGPAGSGSGDDTASEMSDGKNGVKKQRLKAVPKGTARPPGTRENSPPVPGAISSRAGSPVGPVGANKPESPTTGDAPKPAGYITDAEILSALTPEGVPVSMFAAKYGDRLKLPGVKALFLVALRRLTIQKEKKLFKK